MTSLLNAIEKLLFMGVLVIVMLLLLDHGNRIEARLDTLCQPSVEIQIEDQNL